MLRSARLPSQDKRGHVSLFEDDRVLAILRYREPCDLEAVVRRVLPADHPDELDGPRQRLAAGPGHPWRQMVAVRGDQPIELGRI